MGQNSQNKALFFQWGIISECHFLRHLKVCHLTDFWGSKEKGRRENRLHSSEVNIPFRECPPRGSKGHALNKDQRRQDLTPGSWLLNLTPPTGLSVASSLQSSVLCPDQDSSEPHSRQHPAPSILSPCQLYHSCLPGLLCQAEAQRKFAAVIRKYPFHTYESILFLF